MERQIRIDLKIKKKYVLKLYPTTHIFNIHLQEKPEISCITDLSLKEAAFKSKLLP